jgi:hypothetical protein
VDFPSDQLGAAGEKEVGEVSCSKLPGMAGSKHSREAIGRVGRRQRSQRKALMRSLAGTWNRLVRSRMSSGFSPTLWAARTTPSYRASVVEPRPLQERPSLGSQAPQPPKMLGEGNDRIHRPCPESIGRSGMPQTRTMASSEGGHPG